MLYGPLQIRGVGPLGLLRHLIGERRSCSRGRLVIGGTKRPSGGARQEPRGGRHACCRRPGEGVREDGEGRRAALRGVSSPWSGTPAGERPSLPPSLYSAALAAARVQAGGATGLWRHLPPCCGGERGPYCGAGGE